MLSLGLFIFNLKTAPFQEFQRQQGWRHPANSRVNLRPAHQFLGQDEETITLSGVLFPELTGGPMHLGQLTSMANSGQSFPLISGVGIVYGFYVIEGLAETRTIFFEDGTARRIEFTLNLKRVDDPPKPTPRQQSSQNEPGWQIIRGGVQPSTGQAATPADIPAGKTPSTVPTDPNWRIQYDGARKIS